MSDAVEHPSHYNQVPGIECIDVVKNFSFCRGNAIKYLWRAGAKDDIVQDLQKSIFYIQQEISDIEAGRAAHSDLNTPSGESPLKGFYDKIGAEPVVEGRIGLPDKQTFITAQGIVHIGSDPDTGEAGHCVECVKVGHVLAHPDLGCSDVGCAQAHR